MGTKGTFLTAIALTAALAGPRLAAALPACTNNYTGPIDGDWNTAANWTLDADMTMHQVPTTTDVACIPPGKGTIVVAGFVTALVLDLEAQSALHIQPNGNLAIYDQTAGFFGSQITGLTIDNTSSLSTLGSSLALAGTVVVNGELDAVVRLDSGVLSGTGGIGGSLTNVAGTLQPGGAGTVGQLEAAGYTQEAGGTLAIDIASDVSYDTLNCPLRQTDIAGSIVVNLLGGYTPALGMSFVFVMENGSGTTITAQVTPATFTAQPINIGAELTFSSPATTTTTPTTTTTVTTTTHTTTAPSSTTTTTSTTATTATTSSSTTTSHAPTTTTMLLGGDCGSEPPAATFASIDCRLVALLARVTTESDLGASGPKLVQDLSRAKDAEEAGGSACAASNLKVARQRLKQAIRDMIEYAHHLQTLRARKKLPGALRTDLLAAGNPITDAAKSLKRTVECPADAPRLEQ
jgi:Tfp pilus assembly major pilin PilA